MVFVGSARRIEELLEDDAASDFVIPVEKDEKLEQMLEGVVLPVDVSAIGSVSESMHYLVSAQYGSNDIPASYLSYEGASYDCDDSVAYELEHESQVKEEANSVAQEAKQDRESNRVTILVDEQQISHRNAIKDADPVTWYLMNESSFGVKLSKYF